VSLLQATTATGGCPYCRLLLPQVGVLTAGYYCHISKAVLHIFYFSFYLFIVFSHFSYLQDEQTKPGNLAMK